MPRFQFALSTTEQVREAGIVQTDSFNEALTAISEHVDAHEGDTLEIGVPGFPPARFQCVWSFEKGASDWRPTGGRLAA
jgi:hypothetical protein